MTSMKSTEELLKDNKNWKYVRTDRNGTRYFSDDTCSRCSGHGYYAVGMCNNRPVLSPYDAGICWECHGTGHSTSHEIKVYTEEHAAKLEAAAQIRKEKKEIERRNNLIAKRGEMLRKAGFECEDGEWVIYRVCGNTYEIKDTLKELGCKFNRTVGWYAMHELEGYDMQRMTEAQVLTDSLAIDWKGKDDVYSLYKENMVSSDESASVWVGEIGERVQIGLHIDKVFEGEYQFAKGKWGSTISYMYLMTDKDGNKYKWSTSCYYVEGADVKFNATIKDHTEYKGVKQTVLTRCKKVN